MLDDVLGYDCDGNEIYEYRIMRAIFANDVDILQLDGADPRQYCALVANDGKAYAISVYDWWYKDLIREREGLKPNENIPIIVKPIDEMINYECAIDAYGDEFVYSLDRKALKKELNQIIIGKLDESIKLKKKKSN